MKLVNRFSDVNNFAAAGSGFCIKHKEKYIAFINPGLTEERNVELREKVQEICYRRGLIYTNTLMEGTGVLVYTDELPVYKEYCIKEITDNSAIIGTDNDSGFCINADGTRRWAVSDVFFHLYASRDYVFYKKGKDLLICLNINSGIALWQYRIPQLDISYEGNPVRDIYFSKILGFYQDNVWVVLNTGNIMGISAEDGVLKHHCRLPVNWPDEWKSIEYFANAEKSMLDETNGKIFGIGNTLYWEMDLEFPETSYTFFDISKTLLAHNFTVNMAGEPISWNEDEIPVGQQAFAQQPSYAGIFNRKTREITWTSHEMGEEGIFPGLRKLGMAGNRLLVLDAAGTLHVLERE